MWWDSVEGFLRHLSKRTFERQTSDLIKIGVLEIRSRVGHYRDRENHKWFAINYAKLKELEDEYRAHYAAAKAQREKERAAVKLASNGTAGWRPPSGEDTSRQIGDWCSPIENLPANPSAKNGSQSSVARGSRHFGERSKRGEKPLAKMAAVAPAILAGDSLAKMAAVTPAILAAPSLYKRHEDTQRDTTDTASPNLSPAKAGAAVESNLILSENADRNSTTESGDLQEANDVALPQTALGILPPLLPEPVAILAARFAEIATDEYGLKCDEELAARIVSRSPLAMMSDAAVVRLIGPDHEQGGLDKPLFGERKRELAREVPQLRWLLFIWPAHRAEVEAWAARKRCQPNLAGSFITKWEEGTLPPRDWMAEQISAVRAEIKAGVIAEEEGRAKAVWEGLNGPQRAVLVAEAQKRVDERGTGDFNQSKARMIVERRKLLLDATFIENLCKSTNGAQSPARGQVRSQVQTARALETPETKPVDGKSVEAANEPYQPVASERNRMELQAMSLARRLEADEFDLDGAEAAAKNELFWGPDQARYIRDIVEGIVESRMVKEVA